MIIFRERYEGDADRFESALKKAKKGIHEACEIFEDMKDEFSERRGYDERYDGRYSSRYGQRGGYYHRDDEDWMDERRGGRRYKSTQRGGKGQGSPRFLKYPIMANSPQLKVEL